MFASESDRVAARLAAAVAAADLLAVAGFQVFLALGGRGGRAAWGGAHRTLPASLRVASALSSVALGVAAGGILARAGYLRVSPERHALRGATWALAGGMAISALGNFASPSKWERYLMGPNALLLALLGVVVARDGRVSLSSHRC